MSDHEAMKLALEALMVATTPIPADRHKVVGAIEALRAALAAPRPEPVAWHYRNNGGASVMHWGPSAKLDADMQAAKDYPNVHKVTPLYAAPPAAAPRPEPEPVNVGLLEYRGNSVAYIYEKTIAYKHVIREVWAALESNGIYPDGKTRLAEVIAKHTAPPAAAPEPTHPGYVIGSHWLETAYSRICAGEAEAEVLKDCGWERVTDAEALRRDAERDEAVRAAREACAKVIEAQDVDPAFKHRLAAAIRALGEVPR